MTDTRLVTDNCDLRTLIESLIETDGPISIATYMSLALGHPEHGYYMRRDPFGTGGDFVTAPEISQVFGELIGLWCVQFWMDMGCPPRFLLAELGPGRGTLMADALRAAAIRPEFLAATQIHLVETSPALRGRQREALDGFDVHWHARIDDLPGLPALYLANEFFDALPIRQFERTAHGWHERMIGIDPESGALCMRLAPGPHESPMLAGYADAVVGDIAENCPAAQAVASELGQRIAAHGGGALIVDYGPSRSALGDSFQAVRRHGYADPLVEPGLADLTAHVDFQSLAEAAAGQGAVAYGPVPQGTFLQRLGIDHRAAALAQGSDTETRADIAAGVERLTAPDRMGGLFKALALCHSRLAVPAGFAPMGNGI